MTATARPGRPPRPAIRRSSCACLRAAPPSLPSIFRSATARRNASRPRSRCATCWLPAWAIPSPPAKAIRTRRWNLTAASASSAFSAAASASISGRAAPAMTTIGPAKTDRRARPRRGTGTRHGARWMNPACHRSLYSYQVRTTLALAIEQPHLAVTLVPLACTGATIGAGMFDGQRADDCPWVVGIETCSGTAPAQFAELKDIMAAVHRQDPKRNLDMVLLTIGANDVNFAGLVANVIVDANDGTDSAQARRRHRQRRRRDKNPRAGFAGRILRNCVPRSSRYVGGNLNACRFRLLRQSGDAGARQAVPGRPRRPGRASGFRRRRRTAARRGAVRRQLNSCPSIRALATCDGNKACRDPMTDRMTFVDGHQAEFDRHGMCVRAASDPEFDRNCFSTNGNSFQTDPNAAPDDPMACGEPPSDYRLMRSRARWIRTANDSYFTAMTYPEGMPGDLEAERHPRCAVGRAQRRLWRRRASHRRRLCGDGGRRVAGGARGAWTGRRRPQFRPNRCRRRPHPGLRSQMLQRLDRPPMPPGAAAAAGADAVISVAARVRRRGTLRRNAELLLQAGRRRGVLKHQPLFRIDVVVGLLRHQRRLRGSRTG